MKKNIRHTVLLLLMAAVSFVAVTVVQVVPARNPRQDYGLKLEAARTMSTALRIIHTAKMERGCTVNRDTDPNSTGLIGPEQTALTTTLGPLEVKRTTTNPDFAAVAVELLADAGVEGGDSVAAGISGSFPGLALALYAAAEAMDLRLISISSVGASTYGATDPRCTWLDIESILFEAGLISQRSIAASPGGDEDQLENPFFPDAAEMAVEAARRNGVEFIRAADLPAAIDERMEVYRQAAGEEGIAAFINIGGAEVNLGSGDSGYNISTGVVRRFPGNSGKSEGVLFRMHRDGIPVINLLNIRELCLRYGLPVDPIPLPEPGTAEVYFIRRNPLVPIGTLVFFLIGIGALISFERRRFNSPEPQETYERRAES